MSLFAYTPDQRENILRGEHPDCCLDDVCAHCGASEADGVCNGITKLASDLFKAASANAHNASHSFSPYPGWKHFDDHARLLDRAARQVAQQNQGIPHE